MTYHVHNSTHVTTDFMSVLRAHPFLMSVLWVGMFSLLLLLSLALGIMPELDRDEADAEIAGTATAMVHAQAVPQNAVAPVTSVQPQRIIVERLGIDAVVLNPESRDIATLDNALLSGVVHYPGSAHMEEEGNVFLFGHSTGFRVVQNQAFKAFNGLKNAQAGDLVRVHTDSKEYVYRVTHVSLVDAEDTTVQLARTGKKLTLVTCNSFGAKEGRHMVEAEFVGSYDLPATQG